MSDKFSKAQWCLVALWSVVSITFLFLYFRTSDEEYIEAVEPYLKEFMGKDYPTVSLEKQDMNFQIYTSDKSEDPRIEFDKSGKFVIASFSVKGACRTAYIEYFVPSNLKDIELTVDYFKMSRTCGEGCRTSGYERERCSIAGEVKRLQSFNYSNDDFIQTAMPLLKDILGGIFPESDEDKKDVNFSININNSYYETYNLPFEARIGGKYLSFYITPKGQCHQFNVQMYVSLDLNKVVLLHSNYPNYSFLLEDKKLNLSGMPTLDPRCPSLREYVREQTQLNDAVYFEVAEPLIKKSFFKETLTNVRKKESLITKIILELPVAKAQLNAIKGDPTNEYYSNRVVREKIGNSFEEMYEPVPALETLSEGYRYVYATLIPDYMQKCVPISVEVKVSNDLKLAELVNIEGQYSPGNWYLDSYYSHKFSCLDANAKRVSERYRGKHDPHGWYKYVLDNVYILYDRGVENGIRHVPIDLELTKQPTDNN